MEVLAWTHIFNWSSNRHGLIWGSWRLSGPEARGIEKAYWWRRWPLDQATSAHGACCLSNYRTSPHSRHYDDEVCIPDHDKKSESVLSAPLLIPKATQENLDSQKMSTAINILKGKASDFVHKVAGKTSSYGDAAHTTHTVPLDHHKEHEEHHTESGSPSLGTQPTPAHLSRGNVSVSQDIIARPAAVHHDPNSIAIHFQSHAHNTAGEIPSTSICSVGMHRGS
ncbi:MAG: hypothetical protein J3Q66DRAFT_363789 [Benniella sp.]|nr:MAG: hypothetical protein J3Q66DRAFT_363789 [Benniella sp.]